MGSMDARVASLVNEFTPSREEFERTAMRHLSQFFGCDGAWFASFGPTFTESLPPYFQRIMADPHHFDPGQRKAKEITARHGTTWIDTHVYTQREQDRLPVFRELLRPAGISSVVLSMVEIEGAATGLINMARSGRPFDVDTLAEARPLFRAIAIMHRAIVGAGSASSSEAWSRLGSREREVATLAGNGYGALQIAARLGTSVHTVRRQLESVYRKCEISNRAELAALVRRSQTPGRGPTSRAGAHLMRILESVDLTPSVRTEDWQALG